MRAAGSGPFGSRSFHPIRGSLDLPSIFGPLCPPSLPYFTVAASPRRSPSKILTLRGVSAPAPVRRPVPRDPLPRTSFLGGHPAAACAADMSSVAAAVSSCSAKEEPPSQEDGERERAEKGAAAAAAEERVEAAGRELSEVSLCRGDAEAEDAGDDDDDDDEEKVGEAIELGPRVSIKEQLEKDKDDESLRRWKEQLLGSVDLNSVGETLEPDVKITSLSILSPGRPDIALPLPMEPRASKEPWFTLKEGSVYRLKFTFSVADNIVSGLRYTNTVWKTGIKVDSTKEMLGTFSPQTEQYTYLTPEETTPSGMFARGSYTARTKFLDDDGKCHLEMSYTFDIRRDWPQS